MSVATESKGINIPPGTTNRTNRKFKKKFTREIGDVSNIFFLSFFPFDSIYVQNHSTLRSSSTLESQFSSKSLPLFERTKSNLLPFVYTYPSLSHAHSFTVRFIALSLHGVVTDRRYPLLKETRSTVSWSSCTATTCPFARTFSKSALTSLLSKYLLRFIHVSSGIHRKPPWIWHSGSGAKRAFSSTGGNSRKLRERKSKEEVSLREREEGEGLKIETASIILKLPQRNRDVSVEGGSSAKVNVVSPRLLGVRGQCKQILRPYLMFPRCRQD